MTALTYFILPYAGAHRTLDKETGKCIPGTLLKEYEYEIKIFFEQPEGSFLSIESVREEVRLALEKARDSVGCELIPECCTLEGLANYVLSSHPVICHVDVYEPDMEIGALAP